MDKWSYVKKVAAEAGQSQETVNKVMNAMTEVLVTEVRDNGESIAFPGLGTFKQKVNAARIGRNPATGEKVDIPASTTIAFKAQSTLKVVEE